MHLVCPRISLPFETTIIYTWVYFMIISSSCNREETDTRTFVLLVAFWNGQDLRGGFRFTKLIIFLVLLQRFCHFYDMTFRGKKRSRHGTRGNYMLIIWCVLTIEKETCIGRWGWYGVDRSICCNYGWQTSDDI